MLQLHPEFKNCYQVRHSVASHKLTLLRNKATTASLFRLVLTEASQILAYEATRDLHLELEEIETPLEHTQAPRVVERMALVSIMRAGNALLEGAMKMLPFATVGHIGIYRDKFIHTTVEYYFRLPPNPKGIRVLLLDPLLATGETACAAIERLKQYDVGPIRFLCLLAAPEGLHLLQKNHPDVEVITLSVERGLDSRGYILPGIGDAGDRLYSTGDETGAS